MKTINKQKFLAELGRLLTFMYEEDRQIALAMYTRIFDMADNEQAVLQFLVSPTRQAVVLARTYDSSQRKLQAHSQHREDWQQQDSGETPAFVLAIEKLEEEALSLGVTAQEEEEDVNQFSLFDESSDDEQAEAETIDNASPAAPSVTSDDAVFEDELEPLPDIDDAQELSPEPLAVGTAIAAGEAAVQASDAAAETELAEPAETAEEPAEAEDSAPAEADEGMASDDQAVTDEAAPLSDAAEEAGDAESAESAESAEADAADNTEADTVDAFLADFSIKEDPAESPAPAADAKPPEVPAAGGEDLPPENVLAADDDRLMPELDELDELDSSAAPVRTVRKPRVALLLLYIIFAVPIGLIAILILLVPTALSLVLGLCTAASGVAVLLTAFSFTMLADILAVFGAALILLAIAVLFVWLFIWFIGGAIFGVIRGLCSLGRKWCYKEVPADE